MQIIKLLRPLSIQDRLRRSILLLRSLIKIQVHNSQSSHAERISCTFSSDFALRPWPENPGSSTMHSTPWQKSNPKFQVSPNSKNQHSLHSSYPPLTCPTAQIGNKKTLMFRERLASPRLWASTSMMRRLLLILPSWSMIRNISRRIWSKSCLLWLAKSLLG